MILPPPIMGGFYIVIIWWGFDFIELFTNDKSQKHAHAQQKSRKDMCEVRSSSQQVAGIGVKLQMLLPNSCSMGYN
jgi:hypothetical protein